jgi:hypothetical protein
MQTLTQKKPADLAAARARWQGDQIHRDVVAPYGVRRTDYQNCAGFSNEVEKAGVKPGSIKCLENGNKGFRLVMNSDSGREYEVEVTRGHARLGLVQAPRTTRIALAEGSASSESTWTQFAAIIRQKEGK